MNHFIPFPAIRRLCPYPNCKNPAHIKPIPGLSPIPEYRARWRHHRLPCCEWCKTWRELQGVDFDDEFIDLIMNTDPVFRQLNRLERVVPLFHAIHRFYRTSMIGVPDMEPDLDLHLTCERMEALSKLLWTFFKFSPGEAPVFRVLALEIRDMATELKIGPRRALYYTMPKPRHGLNWA